MPAVSPSRIAMKGKLCASMASFGKSAATTSRERGPTTATSAQWSVTDVSRTRRSGHSVCSHSSIQSSTAAAPPVVVVSREVPGQLPLADVLEDCSMGNVPGMDGGHSNRIEEIAAISAGHQAKRNRHIRWAERCHADRANWLPELGGDDRGLVDARRFALVAPGAD